MKEMAAVDMGYGADSGDDPVDITGAIGGEVVCGSKTFAATACAERNKARINDGTNKRDAVVGGLAKAFFRMEREVEIFFQKMIDDVNVAKKLSTLCSRNNNKEVINIATVMMITELMDDETIELVEENIRKKLRSEIADDDAATFRLIK